jgi:hypothetical protein
MKKALLMLVIIVNCVANAQSKTGQLENREKRAPEERVEKQLKKITSDLNLDQKQEASIRQILLDQAAKREQKMAARQQNNEDEMTLPTQDKKAMLTEAKQNYKELKTQMRSILSEDQYAKWEKNQDEKRQKMMEKIKERRQLK